MKYPQWRAAPGLEDLPSDELVETKLVCSSEYSWEREEFIPDTALESRERNRKN